ncbi:hypothetical protein BLNAU_19955 [Blattamonas nauphoetae]|uniref:Uncharacterized protein n=1 Tax=Blattamonas nauphoetae TaxID=2049346 RepID=A0ABQ9WZY4_9EUKA|nr:hypothetical protein BLNAU_19955 [Blattamonas nauphoetae]
MLSTNGIYAFINWDPKSDLSSEEMSLLFLSLVEMVKTEYQFDEPLQQKADVYLKAITPDSEEKADELILCLVPDDESTSSFVESIMILLSSQIKVVMMATLKFVQVVLMFSSPSAQLQLVQDDLVAGIVTTLNLKSCSFTEDNEIIHILRSIVALSIWLATFDGLQELERTDPSDQLEVHEAVFKHVILPSKDYLNNLFRSRFMRFEENQPRLVRVLASQTIRISPFHEPTMMLSTSLPLALVVVTGLTVRESEFSVWDDLVDLMNMKREWTEAGGNFDRMGRN